MGKIIDKIDLLSGLNLNPIPLEFSQSLTTSEWLLAIQSKVNEAVEYVNSIEGVANSYTDEQIKIIDSRIVAEVETLRLLIAGAKMECNKYTDEECRKIVEIVDNHVENLRNLLSEREHIDEQQNTRIERMEDILKSGSQSVICPTCGTTTSIQEALYHIYNAIRVTVTWEDIEELGYTWSEIEELRATWFEIEFQISGVFGIGNSEKSMYNNPT